MSFELRPIEARDIDVAHSVVTTVRAEFAATDATPTARSKTEASNDMTEIKEADKRYLDNNGMFYVMTDRGRVIGTGALRKVSNEMLELRHLYFLRPYRGRGLGHEMLISLLEWAREAEYQSVRLSVLKNQLDAQKLFRSLKFVEVPKAGKDTGELHFELDLFRKNRPHS